MSENTEDKSDWCTLSFPIIFLAEVHTIEQKLKERGITFDTGTGFGARDWELDWSLSGTTPTELIAMLKEISPTLASTMEIYPYNGEAQESESQKEEAVE